MKLENGEYTTQGFLNHLKEQYTSKINGEPFTSNDLAQYLRRGYTPHRYGNISITSKIQEGIRIITVGKGTVKKVAKKRTKKNKK